MFLGILDVILVLGQLLLGTLMLHRLQQSANLRIPSVDQAPELDVPLFEVLGVAFEDLQVLVPVKVVPLPASSVASATSVFRQGLNLLGKRLILLGTEQLPPSLMSPAKTQCSATMRNPFRGVLVEMCFAGTHLSQTTNPKRCKLSLKKETTAQTGQLLKAQTSTYANCQGPGVLHFFSPIPC